MNDQLFDRHVRAAFPVEPPSETADAKIDRALARFDGKRRVKRRVFFTATCGTAIAAGIWVFPAVQAQASIGGMVSAMDRKVSCRMLTYSMEDGAKQVLMRSTTISKGDVFTTNAAGDEREYEIGATTYSYDSTIGAYVQSPRRNGLRMRLSDMLGSASIFSVKKQATVTKAVVNGKEVIRAVIKNGDLPERYIIEADPDSQLPIHMVVESLEQGNWRPNTNMVFDYRDDVSIDTSDLKSHRIVSAEQASNEFLDSMTAKTVCRLALKKHDLIVRAVDVAQDGTVLVAYQSGSRTWNSWRGYSIHLKDDLNTDYVRLGDLFGNFGMETIPKDGTIQMEVFVPYRPVSADRKRTLDFWIVKNKDGSLGQMIQAISRYADGREVKRWQLNSNDPGTEQSLLQKTVTAPTCQDYPRWAQKLSYMDFGNEVYTAISRAATRAKRAEELQDWKAAEGFLQDELGLMRLSPSKGYSSWSLGGTMDEIDKVRAKIQP
ncbi:MAG: hypothetical protein JST51_03115 [Armatimonadetes bacterium]|nr:hypothetical protein [Armatimonadota bacterium]